MRRRSAAWHDESMSLATRCATCGTVFRVVQDQLRVSAGWVRCGRCGEAFNAVEALIDLDAGQPPPVTEVPAEPAPPQPADTPRDRPIDAGSPPGRDAWPAAVAASPESPTAVAEVEAAAGAEADDTEALQPVADDSVAFVVDGAAEFMLETRQAQVRSLEPAAAAPEAADVDVVVPGVGGAPADAAAAFSESISEMQGAAEAATPGRPHAEAADPESLASLPTDTATPGRLEPTIDIAGDKTEPVRAPLDLVPGADRGSGARTWQEPPPVAPSFLRSAERAERWRRPWVRALLSAGVVLGLAALSGQIAYTYRDWLAATVPASRQMLVQACEWLDCRISEFRQLESLVVESSGLVRMEGTAMYRLQVVLRNRAALEVAAPAIDLSLTDAQGRLIARRVLSMADLGLPLRTLKAGSELPIQVPINVAERAVSGYTVEIFYP